jgi:N,N'-diacetylbacillosaminyl-diphospho-undecaprenol alpha-1,3-N-acetylgalactosaminyltransferase
LSKARKKIFYVNNTDWALYNFRLPVLRALSELGYETGAVNSRGPFWDKVSGIDHLIPLKHYRRNINPVADLLLIRELKAVFRRHKPDVVHFFTIKPVIFGSFAAKLARVPSIVHTIPGLGSVFSQEDFKTRVLKNLVVIPLYRMICGFSDFVFFQNQDDRALFIQKGIVSPAKSAVIAGSGVDTGFFAPDSVNRTALDHLRKELKLTEQHVVVSLISRMIYAKGIVEYFEAARHIKSVHPEVVFLLVGPTDPNNSSAIPRQHLREWDSQGTISYLGRRSDIRELLALSDLVVLPSYYGEGIPRILLEAASMGKPIVTTDAPGCRDVVEENQTGLLVKPKNVGQLIEAMQALIRDNSLRQRFGARARAIATASYDIRNIVETSRTKYEELLQANARNPGRSPERRPFLKSKPDKTE